jgi:30S ribosomal protein S31
MGRGDKRTTKGKIWRGSHGKTRSKKTNRPHAAPAAVAAKKEEKKNENV